MGRRLAFLGLGLCLGDGALPASIRSRRYTLLDIVEDLGSMRGVHYVAYVRRDVDVKKKKKEKEEGDVDSTPPSSTKWYRASDSHVAEVSEADVLRCEAYILLYGRVEEEEGGGG